jgi:hypothetical protein
MTASLHRSSDDTSTLMGLVMFGTLSILIQFLADLK